MPFRIDICWLQIIVEFLRSHSFKSSILTTLQNPEIFKEVTKLSRSTK